MTVSPKTNHAEEAREWIDLASAEAEMPTALATVAQAHATLALEAQTARLADAQETANLIAFADSRQSLGVARSYLAALIAARLDLTQDVTP